MWLKLFVRKNQDGFTCKFVTKNDTSILGENHAILPVTTKAPTNQIKGTWGILGGNLFLGSLKSGKVLLQVLYGSIYCFYWLRSR